MVLIKYPVALAAFSAVAAFAQTTDGKPGIQIQGNFNGGYQANSYKGVKVNGIDQNGAGTSSIHFRGLEDLGGGNAAYFHFENDIILMNNATNTGVVPAYGAASTADPVKNTNAVNVAKITSDAASTWGNGEVNVGNNWRIRQLRRPNNSTANALWRVAWAEQTH